MISPSSSSSSSSSDPTASISSSADFFFPPETVMSAISCAILSFLSSFLAACESKKGQSQLDGHRNGAALVAVAAA